MSLLNDVSNTGNRVLGDTEGILSFIISFVTKYAKQLLLIGLVLAGAKLIKIKI
jgi:hypothetical protein